MATIDYSNVTGGRTDGQTDGKLTVAMPTLHYPRRTVKTAWQTNC